MKTIQKAIKYLLDYKPFYADFFLNSKIVYDRAGIQTAAAGITDSGAMFVFNTKFIDSLTDKEVGAVVEHEVLHMLFGHILSIKDAAYDKHIANIAMDLAINQYITELPKMAITLNQIQKTLGRSLLPKETWEYYYSELIKNKDKFVKYYTLDEHDVLTDEHGNPVAANGDIAKAILKSISDKALKSAAGNVSKEVLKVIGDLSKNSKVPWQSVLSNFIARSTSNISINTRKKVNRRYGIDQPGRKKKRELTLGVCVDSSGSVSDASFEQFLAEIDRLSSMCSQVHYVEADCEVQSTQTIKKGKKMKLERKGCGGTAYQPAIDACKKLKCDAILYFGDMDSADVPEHPGVPFLWVIVGEGKKPANFGDELRLD